MITITTLSDEYRKNELQDYIVKINDMIICKFQHNGSEGLSKCLVLASDAVDCVLDNNQFKNSKTQRVIELEEEVRRLKKELKAEKLIFAIKEDLMTCNFTRCKDAAEFYKSEVERLTSE